MVLGIAVRSVTRRAGREAWPSADGRVRGGGRLYPLASLPADVREALAEGPLVAPVDSIRRQEPVPLPPVKAEVLTKWQRQVRDARLIILRELERMSLLEGMPKAMKHFLALANEGSLNEALDRAVVTANARKGKRRALCLSTLRNWLDVLQTQGPDGLAPRMRPYKPLPTWLPVFLKEYRQPQKPSIAWCHEKLVAAGVELPELRTVQRTIKSLGALEANRGRMGPRELKRLKAYVKRDFDDLLPTDVYTGDGHTADMMVQHPDHGRAFRPEIVSILDLATRKCVGWSVGLAESSLLVADALRCGVEHGGISAIFYSDRGAGFRNDMLDGPGLGILARIGTSVEHSIPYNSQARGVIERFQAMWIREAKASPSFVGKDMDREAKKLMFDRVKAEVKDFGRAKSLIEWPQFLAWVAGRVEAYNDRPHSTLPVIRDEVTGKKRHRSPNEQWDALAPQADIIMESPEVLADLFRPYAVKLVKRCWVKINGEEYFSRALTPYHGQEVMVGYDVHDPSRVWIRDLNERPVCTAELNGNVHDYFPKSVVEKAREDRAKGRMERVQRKEEEILAELNGGKPVLEVSPLSNSELVLHQRVSQEIETAKVLPLKPERETERDRFRRALGLERRLNAGENISPEETVWLARYRTSNEYRAEASLYEDFGEAMFGG